MDQVHAEVTIDRPIEEVFAYLTDPNNEATWVPAAAQVSNVSGNSTGVGTTYETKAHFLGHGMDFKVDVTEYQKPTAYTYRATHGPIVVNRHFHLKAVPEGGTQVLLELDATNHVRVLRFAEDVLLRAGRRHEQHSLETLRDILESEGPSPTEG